MRRAQRPAVADGAARAKAEAALDDFGKSLKSAQETVVRFEGRRTSLVGLEEPLITLRNPGIYSIPLGFLCVILGSLLWRRDRRAEELWEELYVRQNTGIHAEQAAPH